MIMPFGSRRRAILLGLTLLLALALIAAACGEEEGEDEIKDIQRSPDTPIVIPADVPIMIGVSVPLPHHLHERGGGHARRRRGWRPGWKGA